MKKQYLIILLFICLLPSISEAQRIRARWKAYRFEWSGGLGASNFLGELGGANKVGTHGFKDFEFKFLDESLDAQYKEEMRLSSIVRYASLLSVWIACMGLFGLATLAVTQRMKEIGIRKVLGAKFHSRKMHLY